MGMDPGRTKKPSLTVWTAFVCERCHKRLSRKTARLIDGKVLCSACMFAPAKASETPQ